MPTVAALTCFVLDSALAATSLFEKILKMEVSSEL